MSDLKRFNIVNAYFNNGFFYRFYWNSKEFILTMLKILLICLIFVGWFIFLLFRVLVGCLFIVLWFLVMSLPWMFSFLFLQGVGLDNMANLISKFWKLLNLSWWVFSEKGTTLKKWLFYNSFWNLKKDKIKIDNLEF